MKRLKMILPFILIIPFEIVHAQTDRSQKKYVNFSFANLNMEQDNSPRLKSNYGAAFSVGKTFFVHKASIADLFRFGIDATWFDINYTSYKIKHSDYYYDDTSSFHQIEIGMQVGPSVTVNPVSKLNIQGYFRYAPSFSGLYMDDEFYGNYATFFVGGGSISFKAIGLGIESRFGNCKYKSFSDDKNEEDTLSKTIYHGFRAYLSLKF